MDVEEASRSRQWAPPLPSQPLPPCYSWKLGNRVNFHVTQNDIFAAGDGNIDALVNSENTDFQLEDTFTASVSGQISFFSGDGVVQCELDAQKKKELMMLERRFELEKKDGGAENNGGGGEEFHATLPVGTVLDTSGGRTRFKVIYHAGFYHPDTWLDDDYDTNETEHVQVIRHCTREILSRVRRTPGIRSVAFPLLGTGVFALSERLVARGFFEDVLQFAALDAAQDDCDDEVGFGDDEMDVWLVLCEREVFQMSLEAGIQAWLTHSMKGMTATALRNRPGDTPQPFSVGVPHIDLFEEQVVLHETHPKYSAWVLVRFVELIVGYAAAVLAVRRGIAPEDVVQRGRPLSFGLVRHWAAEWATSSLPPPPPSDGTDTTVVTGHSEGNIDESWYTFFVGLASNGTDVLEQIVKDRNDIAHGREPRSASTIRSDIQRLMGCCALENSDQTMPPKPLTPPPSYDELSPWLAVDPNFENRGVDKETATEDENNEMRRCWTDSYENQDQHVGVFEKWTKAGRVYIIPWSGSHFVVDRP